VSLPILVLLLASPLPQGELPSRSSTSRSPAPPNLFEKLFSEGSQEVPRTEYGSDQSMVGFHGFLDTVYRDRRGAGTTFETAHANLLLDVALHEDLDARLEFEWENGGQEVEADQVFLDYHPWENGPSFIAGQFYAPFGVERRNWYPPRNPLVSRPRVFREVVPGNWYESGAMLKWLGGRDTARWSLEGAVSNGLGQDLATDPRLARQRNDNNSSKMYSGRAGIRLAKLVEFGTSFATGKWDDAGRNGYSYWGADLGLETSPVSFLAEWVQSRVKDPTAPGGSLGRSGWYLQAVLPWQRGGETYQAFARIGGVDPNDDVRDASDRRLYSLGGSWAPYQELVFKLEYQWVDHRVTPASGSGNTLWLQAVVSF